MSRSHEVLHIDSLAKRFGGLKVFEGISFDLKAGEVLGVIGPNGAGKTTLINVACGMLPASGGSVRLGSQDITRKAFHDRSRMGVVRSFQQTNTFSSATVEENLYRARRFGALRGADEMDLGPILDSFGLTRHFAEPSDKLPYGLQKMLGLVMTLAVRPRFLLLDEPAAGLEQRERPQVDHFIDYAQRHLGCGVLIVEHDMAMVRRLCPQVIVLEAGRLLGTGAPHELLSRPDVIEAYLGASEE